MVQFCAVFGCSNRSNRDTCSFYRFPLQTQRVKKEEIEQTKTRCSRWLSAIRRSDLAAEKLKNARVCSAHFVNGKPARLDDINNCDWVPCLKLGHSGSAKDVTKAVNRYRRAQQRLSKPETCPTSYALQLQLVINYLFIQCYQLHTLPGPIPYIICIRYCHPTSTKWVSTTHQEEEVLSEHIPDCVTEPTVTAECQTDVTRDTIVEQETECHRAGPMSEHIPDCVTEPTVTAECQTDVTADSIVEQEAERDRVQQIIAAQNLELVRANEEIYKLREVIGNVTMNEENMQKDLKKTLFYTGIPNMALFLVIIETMSPFLNVTASSALTKFQQVLLFLMKLRLNLKFRDLAHRFNVSQSTASRTFHNCLDVFHERFSYTVRWPDRDELYRTMPHAFTEAFGRNVAIIIDCFEIFIETPSNLMAKCQTWSTYKHHNTLKFLIGICPQGAITYISEAWGGRVSDKHLTEECGILKNLLPGDIVMADRGFSIDDAVGFHFAQVKIPAFTKGKKQLSPLDVEQTRKIASLRIHVERVIGLTRNKYNILNGPLPREMLVDNGNGSTINKIVRSACALTTMCQSVVPID